MDKGKPLKEKKYSTIPQSSEVLVLPTFPWIPLTTACTFDSLQKIDPRSLELLSIYSKKTSSWWLPPLVAHNQWTLGVGVWKASAIFPCGDNSMAEFCCGFRLKLTRPKSAPMLHFLPHPASPIHLLVFLGSAPSINPTHLSSYLQVCFRWAWPKTQTLKDATTTTSPKQ